MTTIAFNRFLGYFVNVIYHFFQYVSGAFSRSVSIGLLILMFIIMDIVIGCFNRLREV